MDSSKYVKKFRAKKSVLTVYLDKEDDADIIAALKKDGKAKTEMAKKLIRLGIQAEKK